jgi:alkyl hydroperoxide reductase subunit F
MEKIYDLAIIGGGPAGVAAGVYAARKRLKTILITEAFGGQSTESMGIENWIGSVNISGPDFGQLLEAHVRHYSHDSVEIISPDKVEKVTKTDTGFKLETIGGQTFESKTILVATGSTRRKLEIPGAKEYENKGISYCASCDGPLFAGQDLVVIGGGNAGFETAAQLLAYANSVTLLNRSDTLKADEKTVETVLSNPKMKVIKNAVPKEIKGEKFVNTIIYTDKEGDHELPTGGIFVEIGLVPTTWFVEGVVELNKFKQIVVDPRTQRTSVEGVWAAGDSTDGLFHQNNIAAGDAVKALEDIYFYVHMH